MKLIDPSVEILSMTVDPLKLIEIAGRTCYKSEDKITNTSNIAFVKKILSLKHDSVLEHASMTARIICDRGVTHELVRHRIASYSQESTRYCNYSNVGVSFMLPTDFVLDDVDLKLLKAIEEHYNACLKNGRSPQQARYFLPNGLKTEIVVTMNFREWKHFFHLRTAKAAHPDMRAIAIMLHKLFINRVAVICDEIVY